MLRIENLLLRGDGAVTPNPVPEETSLWLGRQENGVAPGGTGPAGGGSKPGVGHAGGPGGPGVAGNGGHHESGLGELLRGPVSRS